MKTEDSQIKENSNSTPGNSPTKNNDSNLSSPLRTNSKEFISPPSSPVLVDYYQLPTTLVVESLFGDFHQAVEHLRTNTLVIKDPLDVRRLIYRYCYERAKGRKLKEEGVSFEKTFVEHFLSEQLQGTTDFSAVVDKFLVKHNKEKLYIIFLNEFIDILQRHVELNPVVIEDFVKILQNKKDELGQRKKE